MRNMLPALLVLLAGGPALATVVFPPRESPLQVRLEPRSFHLEPGEDVLVDVVYANTAEVPIRVLQWTEVDGYPLRFELTRNDEWLREDGAPSTGGDRVPEVDWEKDFILLRPGKVLRRTFNLSRDPSTGQRRHDFSQPGHYALRATYTSRWGLPAAQSSQVVVSIFPKTPPGTEDLQQVCQLFLDEPSLDMALEERRASSQEPLVVLKKRYFHRVPTLRKWGKPVLFLTEEQLQERGIRGYITFTEMKFAGHQAQVRLEHPSFRASARFEKKGGTWKVFLTGLKPLRK